MARIGRIGSRVALVCVVLVAAGWRAPGVVDQPAPLELRVDGTARQAVAGSTLADAVRDLGLKPRPGDLVDVGGVTIAAGRYPGHVLVNGAPLPGGQPLRSGDQLRLVPGPDRTEPVTVRRVPVPGGEPADPEYTLGRVPGDEVTVRGNISGKVASTAFRPTGGGWSDQVVAIASSLGCRVVLWSVDPRDWAPGRTAKGIARSVLSHVEPGSIVIMHDGGGDRTATIRALPRIIRGIRRMG